MSQSVRERLAQARGHARRGEFGAAEAIYGAVLAEHPEFADVHNEFGLVCHEKGDFARAEECFRRALEINPGYTEAALHLAIVRNDVGRYDDARDAWSLAEARSQLGPAGLEPVAAGKIANLFADVGDAFSAAGAHARAVRAFRDALELGPRFHDIRMKLAHALQEAGDVAGAVSELEAVCAQAPEFAPARIALGVTRFSLGDRAAAVACWRAVLASHPDDKRAAMYLRLAGEEP